MLELHFEEWHRHLLTQTIILRVTTQSWALLSLVHGISLLQEARERGELLVEKTKNTYRVRAPRGASLVRLRTTPAAGGRSKSACV